MIKRIFHTALVLLWSVMSWSQLSPGDLSEAHKELEGISNCTQCHVLGNKVSNAKCLDCHNEIATLVDQKRGYHSSKEVVNKDCFECHSDHHGRKFDMLHFDEDAFDHNLTGYKLEGEHEVIDCRACHIPEYIADPDIRKLEDTYLGLSDECLSCHEDYHQQTLDNNCLQCHNFEAFRPAPLFDHDETDYPLTGKHVDVDCIECHQKEIRNGVEFQVFTDIPFNDCIDCHKDVHEGSLMGACNQCHVEDGFELFNGQGRFDHNLTNFRLKGEHAKVSCFDCHQQTSDPLLVFHDQNGIGENQCVSCHDDVHEGRFGDDCAQCHQETSFLDLKNMDLFDHDLTDYPLEGMHVGVDCKECHSGRFSEPIDFSECKNCHEDYHKGEFTTDGVMRDCAECHSLEEGFAYSLYTVEQHQETNFPLEGAHLATPCFACHLDENEYWTFRDIGLSCMDCHDNIHGDQFVLDGVTDCKRCHDSESWYPSLFDHDSTAFPLEGEHRQVSCDECHIDEKDADGIRRFNIERFECIDCHQ